MQKTNNQFSRYSRQIFIEEVGTEGQKSIFSSKVLVIGTGGLGSIVLPYLAAAGVGCIAFCDFDTVEWHNLNRQIIHNENSVGKSKVESALEFLKKLNSSIEIVALNIKINTENAKNIISAYDIIIDCSDNFKTRYLINDTCLSTQKPLVYGSIFAFEGQVAVFNYQKSKNLRDIFPSPPSEELVPNCDKNGVLGPLAGVVASMMAMLALQIITKQKVPTNTLTLIDLKTWNFSKISF